MSKAYFSENVFFLATEDFVLKITLYVSLLIIICNSFFKQKTIYYENSMVLLEKKYVTQKNICKRMKYYYRRVRHIHAVRTRSWFFVVRTDLNYTIDPDT